MRWIFPIPHVTFERTWSVGVVMFRPPGAARDELPTPESQQSLHESWHVGRLAATQLVDDWGDCSTVEVEADDINDARVAVGFGMAILRFLLREIVTVNVDIHRMGLVGETDHAVRDYISVFDNERVGTGGFVVTQSVPVHFSGNDVDRWDADPRVLWLSEQMALHENDWSDMGRRALTALKVLDHAFLTSEPVVRVPLYAVAIEALLSDPQNSATPKPTNTNAYQLANRVAFLNCGAGCARERPACPYVVGINGYKHMWATAEEWASKGEWRCSEFLKITRPEDMDRYFTRPSMFGARNEALHEGRTSLDESEIRWLRVYADEIVSAFLRWVAADPTRSIHDLGLEIEEGAARFGLLEPGADQTEQT